MSVTFSYPYLVPTTTLTIRNPNLSNVEQHNIKTQFNLAMDGSMYSSIDTPVAKTLILTFGRVIKAEVDSFITFFKASAGSEISYTDHDGAIWRGLIINNPFEATTVQREGATCIESSTVTIQFRGIIITAAANYRLLENGDRRLVEAGDNRLLESA